MLQLLVQEFKKLRNKDTNMGCASSKPGRQSKQTSEQQQRTRAATGIISLRDQKLKVRAFHVHTVSRYRVCRKIGVVAVTWIMLVIADLGAWAAYRLGCCCLSCCRCHPRGGWQWCNDSAVFQHISADPQALPESLQQDHRARVLDAASNQLTALPAWLASFTATLNRLVLSNNHLSVLPPELGQLTQLKYLVLDHNR